MADLLQKTIAARSIAKNLLPLQQLCIQAVLSDTNKKYAFSSLSPQLLDLLMQELLKRVDIGLCHQAATNNLTDSLMNANLRTFSCRMLDINNKEVLQKQWAKLTENCRELTNLINSSNTVSNLIIRDLNFFPNLERLSIPEITLYCDQIESLPDLVPNLRILEMSRLLEIDPCCQEKLCQLANMEELAFNFFENISSGCSSSPSDFSALASVFLRKMPHLRIISEEPLRAKNVPCLAEAFEFMMEDMEEDSEQPLQLTHLNITERGLNRHTSPPMRLLKNVTSLRLENLDPEMTMQTILWFADKLTELTIEGYEAELDFGQLARYCPKLEVLELDCEQADVKSSGSTGTPPGQFKNLRRFVKRGSSWDVPATFLQLVLQSPQLQYFICESTWIYPALIQDVLSNESLLKNLVECRLVLGVGPDGDKNKAVDALNGLIAAAPKLGLLKIVCDHELITELIFKRITVADLTIGMKSDGDNGSDDDDDFDEELSDCYQSNIFFEQNREFIEQKMEQCILS